MLKKEEHSESGSPIYRHEVQDREWTPPEFGDDLLIKKLEDHYLQYLGNAESVFHEILSTIVHVDVHWIKPSPSRPFNTLVTMGMSYLPMTVPAGCEALEYAELVAVLPASWPLSSDALEDENNYWPLRLLKMLARFPHEYSTWLGWGHSIPNGDPAKPYAGNTKFCGVVLLPAVTIDPEFTQLKVAEDKTINFYSLVPVYKEEMLYKLRHGADALASKFDEHGLTEEISVARKNVCKRSFWPFG